MKIGQRFNKLTFKEYFFYIDNYKRCKDFNTLGLYRSILENEKLSLEEKIAVRDYANQFFQKTFEFLQVKDPITFLELSTLGEDLTAADEEQLRNEIQKNQRRILKAKRIRHRSFGIHSRHTCAETCVWNGLMVKPNSKLSLMNRGGGIYFDSDKNKWIGGMKALRPGKTRRQKIQSIRELIESE
jgi:hypothetical protein